MVSKFINWDKDTKSTSVSFLFSLISSFQFVLFLTSHNQFQKVYILWQQWKKIWDRAIKQVAN